MSDINNIIRNNPNGFANKSEITSGLCSYFKNRDGKVVIDLPKRSAPYPMQGFGGVPIAYDTEKNRLYVDQTDHHSIIIGQTGSKKSRLVAMPLVHILAAAGESMVISDPKAEIYHRTYGLLKDNGYNIEIINLRNPARSHAWNPLALPYSFYKRGDIDHAFEFANDIAVNLTQMDRSESDVFWDNSAGSLFLGLTLLLFKFCHEYRKPDRDVCIGNVIQMRNILFEDDAPQKTCLWKYARDNYYIQTMLVGSVEAASETRKSILSVFDQKMRSFVIQPTLLNLLSYNDISYDSLLKQKFAVYLITPDEKTGFHNLVSLYVKQSYEYFIYKAQQTDGSIDKRVNYILDEFSSLPKISDFPAMITAARSRNIRFNLFVQSKKQLVLRYGEETDAIMSNCENWIYLASRELGFLKELSELCGMTRASNQKPLLSVTDLQRLDKESGQALVLSARNKPFITNLPDIDWYDNGRPAHSDIHFCKRKNNRMKRFNGDIKKAVASYYSENNEIDINTSELLKNIGAKINELEQEEKEDNEDDELIDEVDKFNKEDRP